MLTVEQFKFLFTRNGGLLAGEVIQKLIRDKPNQQIFAQLMDNDEVRHFMVNLLERRIYEGGIYQRDGQFFFGYQNFPVISYSNNDLQVWERNTKKEGRTRVQ